MGFLDTLIKFSDAHARSAIVILFGVIVVGTIGGGLWIQSLKASLNEHGKLKNSRIELIEERYRLGYASIATKFEEITKKTNFYWKKLDRFLMYRIKY